MVADGSEYDLHNNYDFVRYEYRPSDKEAWLSWRRGVGSWVSKDLPTGITLCFTGVSNFTIRKRDDDMSFSEDKCIASITFAPTEFTENFDAVLQGYRGTDEHLSAIFHSGAAFKIWAESATHKIERPNRPS